MKLAELTSMFREASGGAFVGITDYVSEQGDCVSYSGHAPFSYANAKAKAIKALESAIAANDFQPITVSGNCYHDGTEYNARKRSCPVKPYTITYDAATVKARALEILDGWKNPKERQNNQIALTEKAESVSYNTETGTISFLLLVEHSYYKEEKSIEAKDALGIVEKVEIKAPDTKLNAAIRERFEKPVKRITLSAGKFNAISIDGNKFTSQEIQF
jgi:hypothetical protein